MSSTYSGSAQWQWLVPCLILIDNISETALRQYTDEQRYISVRLYLTSEQRGLDPMNLWQPSDIAKDLCFAHSSCPNCEFSGVISTSIALRLLQSSETTRALVGGGFMDR